MKYIRSNSLKRLFSLKRRVLEEGISVEEQEQNNEVSNTAQEPEYSPRPAWRCFSYEEIFQATNAHSAVLSQSYQALLLWLLISH